MSPDNLQCVVHGGNIRMCRTGAPLHNIQHAGLGDQVTDFFGGLFSTAHWPARWYCGSWSDFHGWLYIISDILIWGAYFLIPVLLMRVALKRPDIPFAKTLWLFVAFIILCGTTHLVDAIIFWFPVYRLAALVRFFTAVVSLSTVYYLFKISPNILLIRSVSDLQKEIDVRNTIEEKLASSEHLFSTAADVGKLAGWEFDFRTNEFTWTSNFNHIFETDAETIKYRSDLLRFFSPSDGDLIEMALTYSSETISTWDHEFQMTTARGNVRWIRFHASPLFNKNAEMVKVSGIISDIDRYKTTQLHLVKSLDQMEQQHAQLKNFTHILSHNLRNHSSNIALLTTFMDTETLDENNAEVFQKITTVSRHLSNTLDDLSQIIRIREHRLDNEELDMREVTMEVLAVMSEGLRTSNASVELQFEEQKVSFPKVYLESILMNLISNGIKYKKDNEPARIALKLYVNEHGVKELQYADAGKGINLDLHADKVFGLYKTFHKHKEANGVGLFLIKNQIEAQGGNIQVLSEVNKGVTFKITFNEHA